MTASGFICDVFFMFSIIKNFRHEKSRLVKNRLNDLEFPQWLPNVLIVPNTDYN